jgi:ketosteroid isomerase-like protein
MSVQEIEALTNEFFDAFSRNDMGAVSRMLSDDLEVFDHVPYRFDNKQQFADFLVGAMAGIESGTFGTRQLSCRVFNDTAAVANAYDVFSGMGKNGKPITLNGRTTLVFAKEGSQWKIVSCHFSPLPTH